MSTHYYLGYKFPVSTWRSKLMFRLAKIFGTKVTGYDDFMGYRTTTVSYLFRGVFYVSGITKRKIVDDSNTEILRTYHE